MAVKAIAYSYWRLLQSGDRTFVKVPTTVQTDVKTLAAQDVVNGKITAEQYLAFIGEEYVAETAREGT